MILTQHIKSVHSKIRDNHCGLCEYKSSTKSCLTQHIKSVHSKIRDNHCATCEYKCSTKHDLTRHIPRCTGKFNGSAGEFQVMKTLNNMEIEHKYNSSHVVKSPKNYPLRWDFIISTESGTLFIEYDGEQHYIPIKGWGGEEKLKITQTNDDIKNKYCKDNNYPLLRIKYTDFNRIDELILEFIMSNTTCVKNI